MSFPKPTTNPNPTVRVRITYSLPGYPGSETVSVGRLEDVSKSGRPDSDSRWDVVNVVEVEHIPGVTGGVVALIPILGITSWEVLEVIG
jgi:hypothetical protein